MRDYSGLELFANVQPEDIEDISERYHLFREVELNSDTMKKVRLRNREGGKSQDVYVISLIEHKSSVDYDVSMQILKYMVCIWENYVIEMEEKEAADAEGKSYERGRSNHRSRINRRKDFRYPPIYPIVYYEGVGEWTAARNLTDRILLGDLFQAYIPDITYKLVRTREYSNEELLSKEDAISLVMLLNKIQQAEDFQEVSKISGERLNEIFQRAPADAAETIVATVQSLCVRLNLTTSETADFIEKVKGGNMGYLFENMEKMDIQLERRNTAEQRQRAEKAERDKLNLYRILISTYRKQGMERKEVKKQLLTELKLEEKEIDNLIEAFWEK